MKKIAVLLVSLLVAGGSFAATASEDVKVSVWPSPTSSSASATNMIESYSGGQRLRVVATIAGGATISLGSISSNGTLEPATVIGSTTFTLGNAGITATVWLPSSTSAIKAIMISSNQSATSAVFANVTSLATLAVRSNTVRCLGTAVRTISPIYLSSTTGTSIWVESSDDVPTVYVEYLR